MRRNRRVSATPSLQFSVLFACGLFAYAVALQFSTPDLGSIDGYFHIRYSALLREHGWRDFPPPFPWLPLTILGPERYFDHHLLFHLWLTPFTLADLVLGAKIASAIGAAAAFVTLYVFLLRWQVRGAHWWTVAALAAAPGFLYRMEMPRVQAWSVVCLLIALHLLLRQRSAWLLPLAWAYTWLYDAFPLLLALCGCAVLAQWLLRRRVSWEALGYSSAGVIAGLVVNPYVPNNLRFIVHHYTAKLRLSDAIEVGAEWYPTMLAEWLGWGGLAAIVLPLAAVVYRHRHQLDAPRLTAIGSAMLFLILFWWSSRFVEYFVPFATIALALTLHGSFAARVAAAAPRWRQAGAAALLTWLAVTTVVAARQLRSRPRADRFAGAAQWLQAHTVPGTLVFLTDWTHFPQLFFHAPANTYVLGLDPTYLAERDVGLYMQWRQLADGTEPDPATAIRTNFGAPVALAAPSRTAFAAQMDRDPLATRAFADDDCIIYTVKPLDQ